MLHVVMCACDDDFSGGISHEELTSDVCMAIIQFEVPKEAFDHCDTNGDGEIDLNEALAALEKHKNEPAGRALGLTAFNRDNFFSDNGNNYNYLDKIITIINENNLLAIKYDLPIFKPMLKL